MEVSELPYPSRPLFFFFHSAVDPTAGVALCIRIRLTHLTEINYPQFLSQPTSFSQWMPSFTAPQIHAGQTRRVIGTLFRNEEWWKDQYYDIYDRGYDLRPRYHPNWEPSWRRSGKNFFAVEDGQPTIVST
jgi:hypothetical protein